MTLVGAGAMAPAHATAPQPAPLATPSCQPWQTPSALPMPTGTVGSKPAPSATPIMVCRNAPPTPFDGPRYAPEQVIGGARLGETGTITDLPAGIPMPPDTGDVSWLLADNSTGEILAAKYPHALLRPASTLKTLEAVTLMPRLDPKQVVIATKEHVAANGSRVGMVAGNPYSVAQLFEALIMVSANDAAYALADAGGGYDETVVLMNAKAKELGAFDQRSAPTRSRRPPPSPAVRTRTGPCKSRSPSRTSTTCCGTTPARSASSPAAPIAHNTPSSGRPPAMGALCWWCRWAARVAPTSRRQPCSIGASRMPVRCGRSVGSSSPAQRHRPPHCHLLLRASARLRRLLRLGVLRVLGPRCRAESQRRHHPVLRKHQPCPRPWDRSIGAGSGVGSQGSARSA